MEGSPIDALFFVVLIVAAFVVLARRGLSWSLVISRNWPVFLFYGYLLISVLWANSPPVSFKRWFKEFGNIAVLLVILTEENPEQALRAVFVRCAYLLLPLSVIFIRWFPSLGRFYSSHGGEGEFVGVTTQKNSLGALVLVCGLIVLWDFLELRREQAPSRTMRTQKWCCAGLLLIGLYLFHMSHSATSMVCFGIGTVIIGATRLPFLQRQLRLLGVLVLLGGGAFLALDQMFGVSEEVVQGLGRDMTFTGRTDVWRKLLSLKTDPMFGVGFMSFWDDLKYTVQYQGTGVGKSAHDGYLEEYLTGGWVGIFLLAVMILVVAVRINKRLLWEGDYGVIRFAIFVVALVANFSESNFACMTPIGFLFLLAAIGYAPGFSSQPNAEIIGQEEVETDGRLQHDFPGFPVFPSHEG